MFPFREQNEPFWGVKTVYSEKVTFPPDFPSFTELLPIYKEKEIQIYSVDDPQPDVVSLTKYLQPWTHSMISQHKVKDFGFLTTNKFHK